MSISKFNRRLKIKRRIRKKIHGSPDVPRISVFRSNKNISAQLIDDINGNTLSSASSLEITKKSLNLDISTKVGEMLAKNTIEIGFNRVVFDRSGYRYHGNVKALAEGARKGGLKF